MITYEVKKKSILDVPKEWYIAHCISMDCAMGAGVAVPIRKKYRLNNLIDQIPSGATVPTCVFHHGVFNLITKKQCYHKPTYETLRGSLISMRDQIENTDPDTPLKIAMPKIGCGLDGLSWAIVEPMIQEVFENSNVEILVCHL